MIGKDGERLEGSGEQIGEAVDGAVAGAEAQPGEAAADIRDQFGDIIDDHAELDLDADDRLPWLESSDDDYDDEGVDTARVFGFVLAGLLALAALIWAIWWFSHRNPDPALVADGSTVAAPTEPYKELPKNPGGKTFAGTGDSSYAVSQGQGRPAQVGGEAPKPSVDTGTPGAAGPAVGVGVQVGAFGSLASAEAGWNALVGKSAALKGIKHRVIEGSADIGKVYRLQAVAGDAAAADALCGKLKASGISCQVKR